MASSDTPTPKTTRRRRSSSSTSTMATVADWAAWYCAVMLLGLILFASVRESESSFSYDDIDQSFRGSRLIERRCDEIYIVGEGETLQTISDKCGDPFIVERNPHIHDPDDVFPGLVIKLIPFKFTHSSN